MNPLEKLAAKRLLVKELVKRANTLSPPPSNHAKPAMPQPPKINRNPVRTGALAVRAVRQGFKMRQGFKARKAFKSGVNSAASPTPAPPLPTLGGGKSGGGGGGVSY